MKAESLLCRQWISLSLVVLCGFAGAAAESASATQLPATSEVAQAIAAALSGWLTDELPERGIPGAAVAVVGRDTVFWEEVYGVVEGPDSSPITPETIFCIRSISKSVTALAVLLAVQDGLVDLDAPISEYLPDFTVRSRFDERPEELMTLRHMLSHRASFTHDPPVGIDLETPGYFERYIGRISETWLRFPVGYRLHYSNYGVDLAAFILQAVSGRPFAEYVQERVLTPLGMTDSSFDLEWVAQRENRAVGHHGDGSQVPVPLPEIAAAGLYSSVRDMAKYVQFHLNGGVVEGHRLLRKDLMEQYHAIQFARRDQRTGYAFGLWREPVSNTVSLYHEGGGRGFGAHLMLYPELGIGIVLLTNKEYQGLTGQEGRRTVNGPIINRYGPLPIADPMIERMRRVDPDDPSLQAILGRYGDSPGTVVRFENGVLGLRLSDTSFAPLTIFDDGGELVGMYFSTMEARFLHPFGIHPGSMMIVNRTHSNSNSHYLDYNDSPNDPPGPDKSEWQQYVGEWDVLWEDEPGSTVAIEIRNGYLYFRDGKCEEHEPRLFFLYDGEALDFRSDPPTFATQEIRRKQERVGHLARRRDTLPSI